MENRLNIGELDTLVIVQQCSITRGSEGEKVMAYTEHSRPFAKVQRTTSETISNGNLEEGQSLELTMYKIEGMSTRWRVLVEGTPYEITSIDPVSRVSPLCVVSVSAIDK